MEQARFITGTEWHCTGAFLVQVRNGTALHWCEMAHIPFPPHCILLVFAYLPLTFPESYPEYNGGNKSKWLKSLRLVKAFVMKAFPTWP
jgi:hypothetical protein